MKNTLLFIIVLVILIGCNKKNHENNASNSVGHYSGAYLGQNSPGLTPKLFAPGFISTGLNEGACNFSPDGKECFFHIVYRKGHDLAVSIANCKEVNGIWSKPEIIHFSGTKYLDMYPFLSFDGTTLYFQSDRPLDSLSEVKSFNIWTSKSKNGKWSNPQPLRNIFDDSIEVSGISVAKSGNIYYTLISDDKQEIYRIRNENGQYLKPERLPKTVNSTKSQFDGVIAPDESYMILGVYGKEDSFGSTDLYVTFRDEDDNWSEVVNLGNRFNTTNVDGPPTISADGKYIFFGGYLTKNNWLSDTLSYNDILNFQLKAGSGNSDIYWVNSEVLEKYRN